MVDDDKMRSCHFYPRVCISEIIFLSSANIINICGIKHRSKAKNTLLSFFETVLNVGFRKVCSGTCVVCGLSAGDLDCLVFNRAFFAVTILVNATWTGKMIIVQKIVFHEIKFNPNLILSFLLLYDNLKKNVDNRQTIFWHKKGFKGEKRRKSLMEKARRDNYLVWCGGPPGRKCLRRRLSSPRPKTSSFLSEKNEFLKSEDLFNSRTWFHASETPQPLHILKVYDFW